MKAKEFLQKAYRIDQRINSKLEQVTSLRELATKATATISDNPVKGTRNVHRMEDIIVKMADLENAINRDIDRLVDTKSDIVSAIKKVSNPEYQTLLELRYLCYRTWDDIADEMSYSVQHIFRLHDSALKQIAMTKEQ